MNESEREDIIRNHVDFKHHDNQNTIDKNCVHNVVRNIHLDESDCDNPSASTVSCNELVQIDGNVSLIDVDSEADDTKAEDYEANDYDTEDSLPSINSESLGSFSNLSMFLPFADHDISCEDASLSDSFFKQGTADFSLLPSTLVTPSQGSAPSKISTRTITAHSLPNIMVTNHRSVFPKFNSLVDELIECEMHVGIHSEIWEDKEKPEHQHKVEEALEIHGILYISNPRPKRRGGGAAITLRDPKSQFTLSKLPVHVPQDIEVCWGLVKPRKPGSIKEIVICSFYCPPHSKKKTKLVEHISVNYFILKSSYPSCAFICGGDKNDLNVKHLLDISPNFHQIVTKPTHKDSILEVIVTDIGHFYKEPIIRPPLLPDIPGQGVPSDHMIVHAIPNKDSSKPPTRSTIIKTSRPFTTHAKLNMASWIQTESWENILACSDSSMMVDSFTSEHSENKLF